MMSENLFYSKDQIHYESVASKFVGVSVITFLFSIIRENHKNLVTGQKDVISAYTERIIFLIHPHTNSFFWLPYKLGPYATYPLLLSVTAVSRQSRHPFWSHQLISSDFMARQKRPFVVVLFFPTEVTKIFLCPNVSGSNVILVQLGCIWSFAYMNKSLFSA